MTYSITFRLQRVTVEYAYVSVPITSDKIIEQVDGTARIDPAKLVQQAIELGLESGVPWYKESEDIHPHPIQKAPEAGEVSFRPEISS
jgi:hypothetical protein